jgi:hypothetical protein
MDKDHASWAELESAPDGVVELRRRHAAQDHVSAQISNGHRAAARASSS